ncbi:vitamin K epoxide reductase family protein [Candidatus Gracilibacteria bacterium]|nr:vitamin K epoxide reductase family protein [Candidatus Gracilibacteria bacterium]
MKQLPKWLLWGLIIVSFIGFLDATYLTILHYTGADALCAIGGCNEVLTSEYSIIFGIPMALLGAIYYLSVFLLSVFYYESRNAKVLKILSLYTIAGLLASAYFVYLQLFVIGKICQYCMLSATTSTILFIFGRYIKSYKS